MTPGGVNSIIDILAHLKNLVFYVDDWEFSNNKSENER